MTKPDRDELISALKSIDRKLSALLSIAVDQYLRSAEGLAKPRPRTIDRLLADAGMLGTEIAATLGKSPQAVSQVLRGDGKPRPGRARTTTNKQDSESGTDSR